MSTTKESGQDNKVAADQDKKKKESRKRCERRAAMSEKALSNGIADFLEKCVENELVAICATIRYARGQGEGAESILVNDRNKINAYYNNGYTKYALYATAEDVRKHRLGQARKLRASVRRFLEADQYDRTGDALIDIALCEKDIKEFSAIRQAMTNSNGTE